MAGGAGDDTYVVDNAGDVVTEAANAGNDTVQSSATYTLGANLENLILTGYSAINGTGNSSNNSIKGNKNNNTLVGDAGDDTLDGGSGSDIMAGGTGDDTYAVDNAGDVVTEAANAGNDTVQSSITYTLGANLENLILAGSSAINGTGNSANNTLTGNAGSNTLDGGAGADTMAGGAGNDTYVVDNISDWVTEAANAGADTVQTTISYTLGLNLENLILTGTIAMNGTGNSANNTITGNAGNNILDGGFGSDIMAGGAGDDAYVVDDVGDLVTEAASAGTDTVQATISYTLGTNLENLILTGTSATNGTGNSSKNSITGNAGNNTLDGGAGADTLAGGTGNDTYVLDTAMDVVTELENAGTDTVKSSISYTLGANLENLILSGASNINGTGNSSNNTIAGNTGNNMLDGGIGDDTLDGGTGADRMVGGAGDDIYMVDNASDVVTEAENAGNDTVQSSISFSLATNIEHLALTGSASINGTGNSANNTITGNAGNNILDGGAGADRMLGGAGNDTYVVDNAGDLVIEAASAGTDTVRSAISYALGSNLENLILTGTTAINGTGNSSNNNIIGNAGNNILNGGLGSDTMSGGSGDDTYVVDNAGDLVMEAINAGNDTVQSSATYALGANLENLVLIGSSAINGTGNSSKNTITGNAGNNTLDGGAGVDILTGLGGADSFRFSTQLSFGASTADHITDFNGSEGDSIEISATLLGLTTGPTVRLGASLVTVSSSTDLKVALDSASTFVYHSSNGNLYWNQNGTKSGFGTGGIFAVIDNYSALSASNISLI
jgi:Ca2+-binding RTX toxin-like protein